MKHSGWIVLGAVAFGALPLQSLAQTAEVITLPRAPGNLFVTINGVSGDGEVVYGVAGRGKPFRWTREGGYSLFPDGTGFTSAYAYGSSDDGSVIVGHGSHTMYGTVAFAWFANNSVVALTDGLGSTLRTAYSVSGDGTTVVGETTSSPRTAAYWTLGSGLTVLPTAPLGGLTSWITEVNHDASIFAGSAIGSGGTAFRWDATNGYTIMGTLGGDHDDASVMGLSSTGEIIVGDSTAAGGGRPGYMWTSDYGMYQLTPVAGDSRCHPNAISADGRVVVGWSGVGLTSHGVYFYTEGVGPKYLESYLNTEYGFNLASGSLYKAIGISNDGLTIVGGGGATEWVVKLPQPMLSDFNLDRFVDFHDIQSFYDCFEGNSILPVSSADLNHDGFTDFFDVMEFFDNF